MWKLKKTLIEDICAAAQKSLPNEFMCFLGGNKNEQIITEVVFLPTQTSKDAASVNELSIPFDETIVGSAHTHPFSTNSPSKQDKRFFAKYEINIIIGYPFIAQNAGFYNRKGERISVELS
jgi:proteasome lid subunit RPN8/RPN11